MFNIPLLTPIQFPWIGLRLFQWPRILDLSIVNDFPGRTRMQEPNPPIWQSKVTLRNIVLEWISHVALITCVQLALIVRWLMHSKIVSILTIFISFFLATNDTLSFQYFFITLNLNKIFVVWNFRPLKAYTFLSRQGHLCNINIKQVPMAEWKKHTFFYKLSYQGSNDRKMKKLHRQRCCYCVFGGHFCSKNDPLFLQ